MKPFLQIQGYPTSIDMGPINLVIEAGSWLFIPEPVGSGLVELFREWAGGTNLNTSCRIMVDGHDLRTMAASDQKRIIRCHVALVEGRALYLSSLDLLDNIALPLYLTGFPERLAQRAALELLARWELVDLVHCNASHLPRGVHRFAAIARALLMKPSILLLEGRIDSGSLGSKIMDHLRHLVTHTGLIILQMTQDPQGPCPFPAEKTGPTPTITATQEGFQ